MDVGYGGDSRNWLSKPCLMACGCRLRHERKRPYKTEWQLRDRSRCWDWLGRHRVLAWLL